MQLISTCYDVYVNVRKCGLGLLEVYTSRAGDGMS